MSETWARRADADDEGGPAASRGGGRDGAERPARKSDLDVDQLDDRRDREELRNRYYGLLQELRVVLPGVQVLLAFLFAVPFAEGFARLDDLGRATYALSLLGALLAVICLMAPTAMHRFGERTARRQRLRWSIRLTMVGLGFLAVALIAALWTVARFVYDGAIAAVVVVPLAAAIPVLWWVLPRRLTLAARDRDETPRRGG